MCIELLDIGDLDDKSSFDTVYVPDPDEEMNFNFGSLESKKLLLFTLS